MEARCVVCDALLDPEAAGAVVHVTEIEDVETVNDEQEVVIVKSRHLRNLTLCINHWKKVEAYLYADK